MFMDEREIDSVGWFCFLGPLTLLFVTKYICIRLRMNFNYTKIWKIMSYKRMRVRTQWLPNRFSQLSWGKKKSLRKEKSRENPPINCTAVESDMATGWRKRKCLLFPSSAPSHLNSQPVNKGRRWLNKQRKVMERFSSVDGGMQCWRRRHEVEERKGVISQLVFRWYYLFLTCALPLTHAEDMRIGAVSAPLCNFPTHSLLCLLVMDAR